MHNIFFPIICDYDLILLFFKMNTYQKAISYTQNKVISNLELISNTAALNTKEISKEQLAIISDLDSFVFVTKIDLGLIKNKDLILKCLRKMTVIQEIKHLPDIELNDDILSKIYEDVEYLSGNIKGIEIHKCKHLHTLNIESKGFNYKSNSIENLYLYGKNDIIINHMDFPRLKKIAANMCRLTLIGDGDIREIDCSYIKLVGNYNYLQVIKTCRFETENILPRLVTFDFLSNWYTSGNFKLTDEIAPSLEILDLNIDDFNSNIIFLSGLEHLKLRCNIEGDYQTIFENINCNNLITLDVDIFDLELIDKYFPEHIDLYIKLHEYIQVEELIINVKNNRKIQIDVGSWYDLIKINGSSKNIYYTFPEQKTYNTHCYVDYKVNKENVLPDTSYIYTSDNETHFTEIINDETITNIHGSFWIISIENCSVLDDFDLSKTSKIEITNSKVKSLIIDSSIHVLKSIFLKNIDFEYFEIRDLPTTIDYLVIENCRYKDGLIDIDSITNFLNIINSRKTHIYEISFNLEDTISLRLHVTKIV